MILMKKLIVSLVAVLFLQPGMSADLNEWDKEKAALNLIRRNLTTADCLTLAGYYLTLNPALGIDWLITGCLIGDNEQCKLAANTMSSIPEEKLNKKDKETRKKILIELYSTACFRRENFDKSACDKLDEILSK